MGNVEATNPRSIRALYSYRKDRIYYNHISNTLDLSKNTLKEEIMNKRFKDYECWIYVIFDHYKNSLLNQNKAKNKITREDILELLERDETTVKDGFTFDEILASLRNI